MKKRLGRVEGEKLVASYEASGLSVREYSEREGVALEQLYYWRRKLRGGTKKPVLTGQPQAEFLEFQAGGQEAGGALRVEMGALRLSFSKLPSPEWLSKFLSFYS